MRITLLLLTLTIGLFAKAQNVGIGQPNPMEKLDVNGNVNITGTLKANGVAGSNGQVLMSTGTGLSWGSTLNYRKSMVLTYGSGTWTVPAGVTEVMVELWGGGSGGSINCGGSSGGYARTVQTVTPGYGIAYSIGTGGGGGYTTSVSGGSTQVTFPLGYLQASGGGSVGVGGTMFPGYTASGTTTLTNNYFWLPGNEGKGNTYTYGQKSASVFVEIKYCGAGGAPVGLMNPTPTEGEVVYKENGTTTYNLIQRGGTPGSGGGAGSTYGNYGGPGLIIIWFNN